MTEAEFAARLLAQGIELLLRNNRLWVWPGRAYRFLSAAEKEFIREHRDALKELVRAGLPETTVVWRPPSLKREPEPEPEPRSAMRDVLWG